MHVQLHLEPRGALRMAKPPCLSSCVSRTADTTARTQAGGAVFGSAGVNVSSSSFFNVRSTASVRHTPLLSRLLRRLLPAALSNGRHAQRTFCWRRTEAVSPGRRWKSRSPPLRVSSAPAAEVPRSRRPRSLSSAAPSKTALQEAAAGPPFRSSRCLSLEAQRLPPAAQPPTAEQRAQPRACPCRAPPSSAQPARPAAAGLSSAAARQRWWERSSLRSLRWVLAGHCGWRARPRSLEARSS